MVLTITEIWIKEVPTRQSIIALRFQQVSSERPQRLSRANDDRTNRKLDRLFPVLTRERDGLMSLKRSTRFLHAVDHKAFNFCSQRLGQLFDCDAVLKQLLDRGSSSLFAAEDVRPRRRNSALGRKQTKVVHCNLGEFVFDHHSHIAARTRVLNFGYFSYQNLDGLGKRLQFELDAHLQRRPGESPPDRIEI